MSSKKAVHATAVLVRKPKSTQSEAVPPPDVNELDELRDVVSRLVAYVVTHTDHKGEGDEMYNEVIPKLLRSEHR